ncbi:hypothetical protein MTR_3g074680 [Medicago truncatula]|uniref:Uncharacterized protein n=1 Tax=Medicago truncatula TaxID=3880 RepID=A0A072UZU0_MEDTR|nr:hypothetical protein MTR_3g074680 [Medicago truncatula]
MTGIGSTPSNGVRSICFLRSWDCHQLIFGYVGKMGGEKIDVPLVYLPLEHPSHPECHAARCNWLKTGACNTRADRAHECSEARREKRV